MKPSQLTKIQEQELRLMIRTFYPDYQLGTYKGYTTVYLAENDSDYSEDILWFEFCMLHLIKKINSDWQDQRRFWVLHDFYESIVVDGVHPVNLLYRKFQKMDIYKENYLKTLSKHGYNQRKHTN